VKLSKKDPASLYRVCRKYGAVHKKRTFEKTIPLSEEGG
jgi:hypothetical protein